MNEHPSENAAPTPAPVQVEETSEIKKESPVARFKPLIALIAGIAVAIGGYYGYTRLTEPVAATVNGTRITEAELNESVSMMTKSAELQGIDVSDPAVISEIRTQALTNLVNNELLLGAAREAGMTANEAAVQTAYESLVTEVGGEDELKTRMETVGLTPETLRGNIGDRIIVDAYLENVTDIENVSVTDEEITAYITPLAGEGVTLPPIDEIRPQIEATLIAQKQQAIVDELIEKLRSEATIEIKE